MFFYLSKLLFSSFLQLKGIFLHGQNNSKYRDWGRLTVQWLFRETRPARDLFLSVCVAGGISRNRLPRSSSEENSLAAPQPNQTTRVLNPASTLANNEYDFSTLSDDCPAAWAEFEGRKGVFIEGQVTPPLSGVHIVISSSGDKPIADITVETDSNGKYRLVCLYFVSYCDYEIVPEGWCSLTLFSYFSLSGWGPFMEALNTLW